jgi:hypothetical protein
MSPIDLIACIHFTFPANRVKSPGFQQSFFRALAAAAQFAEDSTDYGDDQNVT